jgi:predicted type IV restriction endonuclease
MHTINGKTVEHAAETWLSYPVEEIPARTVAKLVALGHLDKEEEAVKAKLSTLAVALKENIEKAAAGCSPCEQRRAALKAKREAAKAEAEEQKAETTKAKKAAPKKTARRGRPKTQN